MWKEITIKVCYDESTVGSSDELEMALERELDRCIQDGLLTPSGEEIVDEYSMEVLNLGGK